MKRNVLITLLSLITIILLFNLFRSKDDETYMLYDPDFYFSEKEPLKVQIVSRNIYTLKKDEEPLFYRGSLNTVKKDDRFYNVLSVNKSGYKRMINGQVFSDVVVSENWDDFFVLVDNNLIYNNEKIDIFEKRFDYQFSVNNTGMFFSVGDTLFYNKTRIEPLGRLYGDNLFFSSDGKSCFYSILKSGNGADSSFLCEFDMGIIGTIPGRLDAIDINPYFDELVFESRNMSKSRLSIKKNQNPLFEGVYLDIKDIQFSPDGELFLCVIKVRDDKEVIYLNSRLFNEKGFPVLKTGFSNNSRHFYYIVFDRKKNIKSLFIDGVKIVSGLDITDVELFGDNYICRVKDEDGVFLLFNDKSSRSYESLPWFCFSDDRKIMVYAAGKKYKLNLFVNGNRQQGEYYQLSNIIYSKEEEFFRLSGIMEKKLLNIVLDVNMEDIDETDMQKKVRIDRRKEIKFPERRYDKEILASLTYKKTKEELQREKFVEDQKRLFELIEDLKYGQALKLIDELLRVYPEDEKLIKTKADIYFMIGDRENASKVLIKLYNMTDNISFLELIVDIYWGDKEYRKIVEIILEALKAGKRLGKGTIDKAIYSGIYINEPKILKELLERIAEKKMITRVSDIAEVYLTVKEGDYNKAGKRLENISDLHRDPTLLALKGIVLAYDNRLVESLHYLTSSLDIRKDDDVLRARSEVYVRIGEFLKAAEDLESISYLNRNKELRLRLSHLYYDAGYYKRSLGILEELLEEDDSDPLVYNALAWLRATCEDEVLRDSAKAVKLAKIAYKLRPDLKTKDTLAAAFAEEGLFKEAIILMEEILRESDHLYYKKMYQLYKNKMRFYNAPAKR